MSDENGQVAKRSKAATRAHRSKRQVISVPLDSPTGWLYELGKYFADEWVILIKDDDARAEGLERGEVLAHGGEGATSCAIRHFREKNPTAILEIITPGLLPRRRRSA